MAKHSTLRAEEMADEPHRKRKNQVNTRLSDEGLAILQAAQDRFGLTYTGAMEMALRTMAEKFELKPNKLVHGAKRGRG